MFCPNCGTTLGDEAKFCASCGSKVESAPVVQSEPVVQPEVQSEPVVQPVAQPEVQSEPVVQPVVQPVAQSEPVVQPAAQAAEAPAFEPVTIPIPEEGKPKKQKKQKEPKEPGKKGKGKLIALLVVLVLVLSAAGFAVYKIVTGGVDSLTGMFSSSKSKALFDALESSDEVYAKEMALFVSGNEVLSQIGETLKGSSRQTVSIPGMTNVVLANDPSSKVLSLVASMEGLSMPVEFYWTDNNIIFGNDVLAYFSMPTENLGTALRKFGENVSGTAGDIPADVLAGFDLIDQPSLSYSTLFDALKAEPTKEQLAYQKELSDLCKKLVEKSKVKQTSSKIEIGGEEKKCKLFTLTPNKDIVAAWLKDDVIPYVEDTDIFDMITDMYEPLMQADLPIDLDVEDIRDQLIEAIEMAIEEIEDRDEPLDATVEFYVYDGAVVSVSLVLVDDGDEVLTASVSAVGEKYRLDDIRIEAKADGTSIKVSMTGSHINTSKFSTKIKVTALGMSETISITWDTKATDDNFQITVLGQTISFTLAKDGDNVRFSLPSWLTGSEFEYKLSPGSKINVPTDLVSITELTQEKLMEIMLNSLDNLSLEDMTLLEGLLGGMFN